MDTEEALTIVEQLAGNFKPGSKEHSALELCCTSILFVLDSDVREKFLEFVNRKDELNGLDIIKLKVYGCEIPEKHKTENIIALESEIDALAAKIVQFRTSKSGSKPETDIDK